MTTTIAERTALHREEAKALIENWFKSGLPDGRIQFHAKEPRKVFLHVPDFNSLIVWSLALGLDIEGYDYSRYTNWCEPDDMHGWKLSVYCDMPIVHESMRIRVGGEPR